MAIRRDLHRMADSLLANRLSPSAVVRSEIVAALPAAAAESREVDQELLVVVVAVPYRVQLAACQARSLWLSPQGCATAMLTQQGL
jgi:hypothetical protein